MTIREELAQRLELSDVISYAMRDWGDYMIACRETETPPIDGVEDFIADAILSANYRKQEWISVKDGLPESGVHVLVACEMRGQYLRGQYVCDGFYVKAKTQPSYGPPDECAVEYSEEDDEYYLLEGWYEVVKNWDDYNSIVIDDFVTHWMPLPQPPEIKEEK